MLLYNGQCYDTCPNKTYKDGIVCLDCDPKCATCIGSAGNCLTCETDLFLYNNNCLNQCPVDTTVVQGTECLDCSINCKYCDTSFDQCTDCKDLMVLVGTQCKNQCPDNYTQTPTSGSECLQCSSNCLRCQNAVDNCTACSEDKYLYNNQCFSPCPNGTYPNGSICQQCSEGCVTCTGENACTACSQSKLKYNGLCLDACPAGYEVVSAECRQIQGESECSPGCTSALLNNGVCNDICDTPECNQDNLDCAPSGECAINQYFTGTICEDCLWPCKSCNAPTSCTACQAQISGPNTGKQMLLYDFYCYDACPEKTMQVGVNCGSCELGCIQCAGDVNTCTECENGKLLYNGDCVDECPVDVTVQNGNFCQPCSTSCATCSGSASTCTTCPDGKVLSGGTCLNECPAGTTTTTLTPKTCKACTGDCENCSGETNACTSCLNGKLLYNNSCLASCPANTTVEKAGECVPCESPCVQCSGDTTLCTLCISPLNLSGQTCVNSCPSGQEARVGICENLCAEGCTTTLLNNTDCDVICNYRSCNYDQGLCTPNDCPLGQYRQGENCLNCSYPCSNCSSPSYCTSCQVKNDGTNTQLLLSDGQCLENCPSQTVRNALVCLQCKAECKECGPDENTCISCPGTYKLYNGGCINTCPTGTTIEISGVCEPCNTNCKTCSGTLDTCTSCNSGSVLSGGQCTSECDPGFTVTSTSAGKCVSCQGPCVTCLGEATTCTSCSTGKLYEGSCVDTCPQGYTALPGTSSICTKCSDNCVACQGSLTFCTACTNSQILTSSNTCQDKSSCPDGKVLTATSGQTCVDCLSPCGTCETTQTNCITCISGMTMINGTCEPCQSPCATCTGSISTCVSCDEGYYTSGVKCLQCSSACRTCENVSNQCTSCPDGYFLVGTACHQCLNSCSACENTADNCTACGTGKLLVGNTCVPCDGNCASCENTKDNCTGCSDGFYLSAGQCLTCSDSCATCQNSPTNCTGCKAGQTNINGECGACDPSCKTCSTSFSTCDSCFDGNQLVNGVCGVCKQECLTCSGDFNTCGSCGDGKYLSSGSCPTCDSNCATCQNSATNCTSCNSSLTLINNQCAPCSPPCLSCEGSVTTCTACASTLSLINNTCVQCNDNCKTCEGSVDLCTSCSNHKYLQGSTCVECSDNCLTCELDPGNCTSCPNGSELQGSTCFITCPEGFTRQGVTCVECSINCKTCQGTRDTCKSCNSGYLYKNTCVNSCPDGYYQDGSNCEPCSTNCTSCSSSSNCLQCIEGYKVRNNSCVPICPTGQYLEGGACIDCNPDCQSCSSLEQCTSCVNKNHIINSFGKCELPCEAGYTRDSGSVGVCIPCSSNCKLCSGSTSYCTACANPIHKLYNGECMEMCPIDTTVAVGDQCLECDDNCLFCGGQTDLCKSCHEGMIIYKSMCLAECPTGYEPKNGICVECSDPSNCPYVEPNPIPKPTGSEDVGEDTEDMMNMGKVPFPFSGVGLVGITVVAVSKAAAAGVALVPACIATISWDASASWILLPAWTLSFGDADDDPYQRRLVSLDPGSNEILPVIAVILMLIGLGVHYVLNTFFMTIFLLGVNIKDQLYREWKRRNRYMSVFVVIIGYLLSFHLVRILFSGLCNKDCFKASFDNYLRLYKPLIRFSYVSLLCTIIPMIMGQTLLLIHYQWSDIIWMFALDSLFLTFILFLLIICDIRSMERTAYREQLMKDLESNEKVVPDNSLMEYTDANLQDVSLLILKPKSKKAMLRAKSVDIDRDRVEYHRRTYSYPLIHSIPIEPQIIQKKQSFNLTDEPNGEESIDQRPLNESQFIQDDILLMIDDDNDKLERKESPKEPITGELLIMDREIKVPFQKPFKQSYMPLQINPNHQEITEIEAYTEEDDRPSTVNEEPVANFPPPEEVEIRDSLFDIENAVGDGAPPEKHLGTVEEEEEFDFTRAIPDASDPEVVVVPHKQSGQRFKLKKGFKGARIVDLENKVAELPPINDTSNFDIPETIIDEQDPHIAQLLNYQGQRIKVKRNFRGARIVDLEQKVQDPNENLIGQMIQNEQDFQFNNAYPDHEDPEVVVVMHNETGEDVRVRKTFHGARIIDNYGKIDPNQLPIDRKDYDIPATIVDQEDVHLATLKNRFNKQRIRVRREFKGAKIIDLEKKSTKSILGRTIDREPEPISPPISPKLKPRKKIRPLEIEHMEPDPAAQRLQDLAQIISAVEKERADLSAPQLLPETPDYNSGWMDSGQSQDKRILRKPIYHNTDLDKIYGYEPASESRAGSGLSLYEEERVFFNKKPHKKMPPMPNHPRIKDLESIYLQRLEARRAGKNMTPSDDNTISNREFFRMDDDTPMNNRINTSERVLSLAGDEIAYRRAKHPLAESWETSLKDQQNRNHIQTVFSEYDGSITTLTTNLEQKCKLYSARGQSRASVYILGAIQKVKCNLEIQVSTPIAL